MNPDPWEDPQLWQRLKPLFDAAMGKPETERARFIDEACGEDPELREALRQLVNASGDSTATADARIFDLHKLFPEQRPTFVADELVLERFRIVRLIGSGGMGEVYEAVDLELGQRIALKTIRAQISGNPKMLAHFKNEVKLAKKISGLHVCRIHELYPQVETPAGYRPAFLTMEFLDGVTLADRIRDTGPPPWKEVKAIALEICEGLRAMHEAGIIHRDLKSRNVMLADRNGTVKAVIMDFGLAHELPNPTSETASELSEEYAVAGTPEYMAPEQFEGKTLTPAADIFALGVVMYEMATGRHPFPSHALLEAAVQRGRKPVAPSSLQKKLPHRCDEIVGRCLEFDPKKRYGSAKIVAEEIKDNWQAKLRRTWLRAGAAILAVIALASGLMLVPAIRERVQGILFSSREKHIAVLPFEVAGNDLQTQALGDGLMDSLTGKLSNLDTANQTLWVVPASEVRARKVHDASSALKEFGATIVVEGNFERNGAGAHLRLTLIDPKKMREIGFADAENVNGDLAALEDDAVIDLGRLMNVSASANIVHNSQGQVGRAAYEDYLAGVGYFQRFDKPGNIERAIDALRKAVRTDPHFALGFARLAQVYDFKYRIESNPDWLHQAETYGKHAAELDDRVPLTYVVLGNVLEDTGNHELAVQQFQRALDLDPRNADALTGIASSYERAGLTSQAEAAFIRSASLRPNDWAGYNDLGNFYDSIGRHKDAVGQFRKAIDLSPDNSAVYVNLGIALLDSGDPQLLGEAEEALKKSIALNPTYEAYSSLGVLFEMQHRYRDGLSACEKAIKLNNSSYDAWNNLAIAYEWAKKPEQASMAREHAINLLEKVVALDDQNAEARATLGALMAKTGMREKSMEDIRISLALSPKNQYVLSEVADAYALLGDRVNALKYLKEALEAGMPADLLSADPDIQGVLRDATSQIPPK
jgi:eukaryotic-like serine/threonine-protein kinase